MTTPADLAWPFFDDGHRALVPRFERWVADELPALLHGAEDPNPGLFTETDS